MSPAALKALAASLRQLADMFEAEATTESVAAPTPTSSRYYTRKSWAESGGEARVFDRAIASIRSFRAGRRRMVLCDEMHAWIESQVEPVAPKKPAPVTDSIEVSDVDRELGRMGEPPRTDVPPVNDDRGYDLPMVMRAGPPTARRQTLGEEFARSFFTSARGARVRAFHLAARFVHPAVATLSFLRWQP